MGQIANVIPDCELCHSVGGQLLWQDSLCRVVLIDEAAFPGFCRVIWQKHVGEMTQLSVIDRRHLMDVVYAVEFALREVMRPDKINLASLGNMTPHLHWHVIPRWTNDSHFPLPVWALAQRAALPARNVDALSLTRIIKSALAHEEAESG